MATAKYVVYDLEVTETGRIKAVVVAYFADNGDALGFAKQRAVRIHLNTLVVHPEGFISVHSEHA